MKATSLIAKAGVGLSMFHLARNGLEFVTTIGNSDAGDMWVRLPVGGLVPVEIKASFEGKWNLRREQLTRVKFIILTDIGEARCWVLSQAEVLSFARNDAEGFCVVKRALPKESEDAWSLFGVIPMATRRPRAYRTPPPPSGKFHRVRKLLANGQIKEYTYDRRSRDVISTRIIPPSGN